MKKYYYFVLLLLLFCGGLKCFAVGFPATSTKLLSLDFREIKVSDLLQLLAEFSHKNIVISDKVAGKISLNLHKVSWQEALNLVLNMQGLVKQETNNTLFIAPATGNSAVVLINKPHIYYLHYAEAKQVAELLAKQKGLLSSTGSVNADLRTNSILAQDVPAHLDAIYNFIQQVDIPVKQVLIEGRIVSIDSNYTRDLGLKFGTSQETNVNNNDAGGMNMDLPTSMNNPGQFGIALAKLGEGVILDMELSALETEGHANIISRPKLLTSNNKSAYIESGQEIPYQEKTSSGATNIAFKKAVLSLKVTPEIISHDKVLLKLLLNQDKLSSIEVNGIPAIQTQQMQTQVEVHNNQTLVLGGIYEVSNINNITKIPFLSAIPLFGKLFQHKHIETRRKELLIFVTPKVI